MASSPGLDDAQAGAGARGRRDRPPGDTVVEWQRGARCWSPATSARAARCQRRIGPADDLHQGRPVNLALIDDPRDSRARGRGRPAGTPTEPAARAAGQSRSRANPASSRSLPRAYAASAEARRRERNAARPRAGRDSRGAHPARHPLASGVFAGGLSRALSPSPRGDRDPPRRDHAAPARPGSARKGVGPPFAEQPPRPPAPYCHRRGRAHRCRRAGRIIRTPSAHFRRTFRLVRPAPTGPFNFAATFAILLPEYGIRGSSVSGGTAGETDPATTAGTIKSA